MLIISITSHCLKRLKKIKRKCINIDSFKIKYLFALIL